MECQVTRSKRFKADAHKADIKAQGRKAVSSGDYSQAITIYKYFVTHPDITEDTRAVCHSNLALVYSEMLGMPSKIIHPVNYLTVTKLDDKRTSYYNKLIHHAYAALDYFPAWWKPLGRAGKAKSWKSYAQANRLLSRSRVLANDVFDFSETMHSLSNVRIAEYNAIRPLMDAARASKGKSRFLFSAADRLFSSLNSQSQPAWPDWIESKPMDQWTKRSYTMEVFGDFRGKEKIPGLDQLHLLWQCRRGHTAACMAVAQIYHTALALTYHPSNDLVTIVSNLSAAFAHGTECIDVLDSDLIELLNDAPPAPSQLQLHLLRVKGALWSCGKPIDYKLSIPESLAPRDESFFYRCKAQALLPSNQELYSYGKQVGEDALKAVTRTLNLEDRKCFKFPLRVLFGRASAAVALPGIVPTHPANRNSEHLKNIADLSHSLPSESGHYNVTVLYD